MAIDKISLTGLTSSKYDNVSLGHIDVSYNGNVYKWTILIPAGSDINTVISNATASIQSQIDAKETAWTNLNPKSTTVTHEDGSTTIVPILHDEFVVPDNITGYDIDDERDRRRYLPHTVTLSSAGTFMIDMDITSQSNIQALTTIGMYLQSAAPSQITVFRDHYNVSHNLLPSELISMGLQVASYIQKIYAKSWALKALPTIPIDYNADSYWT